MQTLRMSASIAIVVILLILCSTAHADTYKIFDLGDDNGQDIVGIDASGTVVAFNGYLHIYFVETAGGAAYGSTTAPGLTYDNGTPCSPVLAAGMSVLGRASCNNGHEVFGGYYLEASKGLYTGPDPADFLQSGSVDALFLNSVGDFAWSDGQDEENYLAIDLTTETPEPSSILLLGTGLIAAAGMRRRLFS